MKSNIFSIVTLIAIIMFFSQAGASTSDLISPYPEQLSVDDIFTLDFLNQKEDILLGSVSQDIGDFDFSPLKAGNTTKAAYKVKTIINGKKTNIALIKATDGNTKCEGEIISYRFAKLLGYYNYAIAVPLSFNSMGKNNWALKEWVSNFSYYYWQNQKKSKSTFSPFNKNSTKRKIVSAINCDSDIDLNQKIVLTQNSKNKVKFRGSNTLMRIAEDFSTIMLFDMILGNEDRFPGANLHFMDTDFNRETYGGTVNAGRIRLFSLDNGATLRRGNTHGKIDFKDYVSRFDRKVYDSLVTIDSMLSGRGFDETIEYPEELDYMLSENNEADSFEKAFKSYLFLDEIDTKNNRHFKLIKNNIRESIQIINDKIDDCRFSPFFPEK